MGLRGNGMVFAAKTLRDVPYSAYSVVEDVEFGIMLGESGRRVVGCDSTWVLGDMPTRSTDSAAQRIRWELGRATLRRERGRELVLTSIRRSDPVLADLTVDLYVPPISTTVAHLSIATVVQAAWPAGRTLRLAIGITWAALGLHILAGVVLSQSKWRAVGSTCSLSPGT